MSDPRCWKNPLIPVETRVQNADGEIERLLAKLAIYQERERLLIQKLTYVLQQNDLDMLLTGEEIRECRTIIERLQTK